MHIILFPTVLASNIGPDGTATQSSTESNGHARYAIDGNVDGDLTHHSCTLTAAGADPWWKVTFKDKVLVFVVIITNRADCCGKVCFNNVGVVDKTIYPNFLLLGAGGVV